MTGFGSLHADGGAAAPPAERFRQARVTLEMIKFSHTIFALPFALLAAFLAAEGPPPGRVLVGILGAMVGARSAAMAFNRLVDAEIDARNPRTAMRALPAGLVSRRYVTLFVIASVALFVASAAWLNPLCLNLSPLALAVVLGYSLTKRFTRYSHLVLGFALGIAPTGAWLAVTGAFAAAPLLLTGVVTLWTAGFDIIYACQDVEFDRREGLHSLPLRLGVGSALRLARRLHLGMLVGLGLLPLLVPGLSWIYWLGVGAVAAVLHYEHGLVSEEDLSRIDLAFFTLNGVISLLLAVAVIVDIWLGA
jgi:4-hydroxybenzoate polyprenyltransferase